MKYIIDIPTELAEATARYWNETTDMTLVPYTEPDRKTIEDEVWEFVRNCLMMDGSDFMDAFDSYSYSNFLEYSYQIAKARYKAWLKQKNEIHVGDEVTSKFGDGVVIDIVADESVHILGKDGHWNEYAEGEYQKTGRHFDEVGQMLEKMRGEEQ